MDKRELARICSLYNENLYNAVSIKEPPERCNLLAMIATIVDVLRADAKKAQKTQVKTEEVPVVPLSVLQRQDLALYSALFSIGCENLNDIEGYRENITDDCHKVIEIMIGGRFAALSEEIGSGEMMTLAKVMEENGLPPLSRWSK